MREDSFVPLPLKKSGATTKKTDECRVKKLLEMCLDIFLRQINDDWWGEMQAKNVGAGLPAIAVYQRHVSRLTLRYRRQASSHS